MKKRFLNLFLVMAMIVCVLPFSVFADGCAHTSTRHDILSATCVDGYDKLICKDCGATVSTTVLKAKEPHIIVPTINDGKCLNCGSRCDHKDFNVLDEEPATCRLTGYIWKKCNICQVEFNHETDVDENAHTYVNGKCSACGTDCLHNAGTNSVTTEANCAEEGSVKVYCKVCNKLQSETTLEKTNDHTYLPNHKDGMECLRCHAPKQTVCEHDYEVVNTEPATCSMTGYVWEVCKLCGKEYNHETPISASAHNFKNGKCSACFKPCLCDMERQDIKMASCHEEGYIKSLCVKCGKVLSEKILPKTNEHLFLSQYEDGNKCRLCNANKQDVCEHDYNIVREQTGTCIEAGYVWKECKLCGYETNNETAMNPDGHDFNIEKTELATCEKATHVWKRCILCAYKTDHDEGEKLGHIIVESTNAASCTEPGTRYINCTRCRVLLDTEVLPAGHKYVNGKCTVCGAGNIIQEETKCKHPESDLTKDYKAATCTEGGHSITTCKCGAVVHNETWNALGHTYVNGKCKCGAIDPTAFVAPNAPSDKVYTYDFQEVQIVGGTAY